jgi:hypothetical protein
LISISNDNFCVFTHLFSTKIVKILFIRHICTENFCVFTHLFSVAKKQGPDFVLKTAVKFVANTRMKSSCCIAPRSGECSQQLFFQPQLAKGEQHIQWQVCKAAIV